eukprot:2993430-Prymnesium_polylepis.1
MRRRRPSCREGGSWVRYWAPENGAECPGLDGGLARAAMRGRSLGLDGGLAHGGHELLHGERRVVLGPVL